MKTVVVYESILGNTRQIAEQIADAARLRGEVVLTLASHADPNIVVGADLVVVGGPTHIHGLARPNTRRAGAAAADKDDGLTAEPEWDGPGVREWLRHLGHVPRVAGAAFDTRIAGPAGATGRASKVIARRLRHHGFDVVAEPESFLVDKQNRLLAGEIDRAHVWAVGVLDLLMVARSG